MSKKDKITAEGIMTIYDYICEYYSTFLIVPTYRQISEEFNNMSTSCVKRRIDLLIENGLIISEEDSKTWRLNNKAIMELSALHFEEVGNEIEDLVVKVS